MKFNEIKELHNKSLTELKTLLKEAKNELAKLKMDLAVKKLKNVHAVLLKRRDISRLMTVIREKELMEEK